MIKLTANGGGDVFVNPEHIGHIVIERDIRACETFTRVGVTTHNNGGFKIKETPEQIIKLINHED